MTDEYCTDDWVCGVRGEKVALFKQWHYRIVMGTVGYGLKRFKDTEELLRTTYDVFHGTSVICIVVASLISRIAMRDSVTNAARLHRDISLGNILLVRNREGEIRTGYLIDWDTSCPVSETGECIEAGRVVSLLLLLLSWVKINAIIQGTWQFMSYRLLAPAGLERKPTLQDDMESLFYVVLYCSLLWLPHNLSKEGLRRVIRMMFDIKTWIVDHYHGGDGKTPNALDRHYTKSITFKEPLHEWLQTVMDYFAPPRELQPQYKEYWSNPDHLEAYWGDFLRTHTFEADDRVVHDHPAATGVYVTPGSSIPYSTEVVWFGEATEDGPPAVAEIAPRKRRAPPRSSRSASPQPLRRSKRLKAREDAVARGPRPSRNPVRVRSSSRQPRRTRPVRK